MLLVNEIEVIKNITEYLKTKKCNDLEIIELYNNWTHDNKIILSEPYLTEVAISFLNNAKVMDMDLLNEASRIDQNYK